MNDQFWQSVRYILIGGGGYLAGRGKIAADQVIPLADQAIQIGSGAVSVAAAAWGLYVKFRTATVPAETGERHDVPVVSSATGKVV